MILEMRTYVLKPGALQSFEEAFTAGLPDLGRIKLYRTRVVLASPALVTSLVCLLCSRLFFPFVFQCNGENGAGTTMAFSCLSRNSRVGGGQPWIFWLSARMRDRSAKSW